MSWWRSNYHCERFGKLVFQVLGPRQSRWQSGNLTLINLFDKTKFLFHFATGAAPQFLFFNHMPMSGRVSDIAPTSYMLKLYVLAS